MIAWFFNVLVASILAFLLNSVYQAKRERKKSSLELYTAIEQFWSGADLMVVLYSQASIGMASFRTAYDKMEHSGLPDHASKSRLNVLVKTDHEDCVRLYEKIMKCESDINDIGTMMLIERKSLGVVSKNYEDMETYRQLVKCRDELSRSAEEFKSYVKGHKFRVTWREALKEALLP